MDYKKLNLTLNDYIIVIIALMIISCNSSPSRKGITLYKAHCSICHITPSINDLPKAIWKTKILPEMGARLGVRDTSYNPLKGLSFGQKDAINKTRVYLHAPMISEKNWEILKNYIISNAPDSLVSIKNPQSSFELSQFQPMPITFDKSKGPYITFLKYDDKQKKLLTGDLFGNVYKYDFNKNKNYLFGQFGSAVVDIDNAKTSNLTYVTAIGYLRPSEISSGHIYILKDSSSIAIPELLHRPVNTLVVDLNGDGKDELVVSEFGNLKGELSLLIKKDNKNYEKRILLNQPGSIRVLAKDMNGDGKKDLIALTAQGDETITILYQEDNLTFRPEKVIRFSPIYGISWFELIDYNGDGFDDIITANGDNADKSYIQKPYHGMRIFINDGKNNFKQKYFYPMNGATRLLARDFDKDGDTDFAIISSFPDYKNKPKYSFVYLENINSKTFTFKPFTFKDSKLGRWLLMDAADIDNDGDLDIILSSFTYYFTPVPKELSQLWKKENVDIMVLKNNLIK